MILSSKSENTETGLKIEFQFSSHVERADVSSWIEQKNWFILNFYNLIRPSPNFFQNLSSYPIQDIQQNWSQNSLQLSIQISRSIGMFDVILDDKNSTVIIVLTFQDYVEEKELTWWEKLFGGSKKEGKKTASLSNNSSSGYEEKDVRFDIIEASISNFSTNKLFSSFEKARCVNKIINNQIGIDITSSYKRASNILQSEMENKEIEITNSTDPGIFKSDYEKNLFKKITDIKKYYSDINNNENFEESLSVLAGAKKEVFEFFDNVKVNEDNEDLRKNRLELINMLCKPFQNFMNFQLLKANNE